MRPAETIVGRVAGLHVGTSGSDDLGKTPRRSVSVELDGDIDLRGFFGVDETVRPGYEAIRGTVTVDSLKASRKARSRSSSEG